VDPVNGGGAPTVYDYDVNDRPTVVTAPNVLSTQYQHDDLGNLLKEVSPDRRTTHYTHDAAGNVLTVKDARNITTTYTYDALNRVASTQSSNTSTPSYTYAYDTCFKGRLCYFPGTFLFGYDSVGRLNYQLDLKTFLYSSYVFTSAGRLTHIDYPNGAAVDYAYDFQNTDGPKAGNVVRVSTTIDDTTTVLAQNLSYYPFGPLNSFSFGNGQYFFMNVDQAYRPTFQRSGPRWKNAFYDPAGNLNALDDINGTAQTFTYGALNELTSASDTQTGSYGSLSYTYLPNGNRETETRNGTVSEYAYVGNRLSNTSSLNWLYDAAGNAYWSNYAYVMGYDGYGRMISALSGAATYEYNPLNQRTKKTAGGITTRFHYGPSGELLFETGGGGNKAYVYLNGMPLARIDSNSQIYYYHTDHLGAPQLMTNSAGITVWKALYEPFGKATVTVNTIANNLRYAGQYFDQETGLHYNWHRYYDPKVGRYISSDPIGLEGGLNTYSYAYNNPLRWTDPTGLMGFGGGGSANPGRPMPRRPPGHGNLWGGPSRQDMVCTKPMITLNPCVKDCCISHDECYERNGCNWSSWFGYSASACQQQCNIKTINCVLNAIGSCDKYPCIPASPPPFLAP
jgi:RHS repeat-associated protein